ncbi:M16 family metallopeptidase [Sphingomonas mesophila]|uniref:M16 family metallopeptidase n=1 Tax=Sphingomonas mesophila TaxID=2303576 RepID=UPI000E579CDF|nr:pitrilysin family protein [Sphingomonas mesophila]
MMHCSTLANGLCVASRPMQSVETVAVGLYAPTGSRFEAAGKNGLAHLFEHMVFKGAGGRSARQISELIEDVGGDLNASTDREITGFYASLLAPDLKLGVDLLADLIRRPHFEAAHLDLEKKVVLQELAETRDTAGDIVFDLLQEAAFPDQPIGRSVLGSADSLAAIRVDDLHAWQNEQFAASNLVLVAAGKLEHARLVDLAEAAFGSMPSGARPASPPARFVGGQRFERRRGVQAHLAIAMAAPAWGDGDAYAAQLFADVAGGGSSSHLFQRLREDNGLAYSVSAAAMPFADCGLFYAYAAVDRGEAGRAQDEIEAVLAECARELSQRDLERARAMAKAGMMMSLESCWGQAYYVATRLLREGALIEPTEIVARLDAITLDQVRAVGTRMLAGPRALSSVGAKLALAA